MGKFDLAPAKKVSANQKWSAPPFPPGRVLAHLRHASIGAHERVPDAIQGNTSAKFCGSNIVNGYSEDDHENQVLSSSAEQGRRECPPSIDQRSSL